MSIEDRALARVARGAIVCAARLGSIPVRLTIYIV